MKFKIGRPAAPKFNKTKLTKIAIVTAVLVAIVLVVVGVAQTWEHKQKQDAVDAQKTAAAQKAKDEAYNEALFNAKEYKAAYDSQRINCEKGQAIYNNVLTTAQKKTVEAKQGVPACGPAVPSFARN